MCGENKKLPIKKTTFLEPENLLWRTVFAYKSRLLSDFFEFG